MQIMKSGGELRIIENKVITRTEEYDCPERAVSLVRTIVCCRLAIG
jgi:hypothetical protein